MPDQPEFIAKSDMRNVVLKKEMKFPNAKVFRAALRKYAIKKSIDIKLKFNERTKISVHYKNECGWRCYASQISGELTFQIKTLTDDCTCPSLLKTVKQHQLMLLRGSLRILAKIQIGR